MKTTIAATLLALCAFGSTAQAEISLDRGAIIAPDATLETVYDGGIWLEGPVQAPDGKLYFTDVTISFYSGMQDGSILSFDPKNGNTTVLRSPSGMANGLAIGPDGALLVAAGADFGCRCVTRTDARTSKTTIIAGTYDGRPFNSPNDLVATSDGTTYFSDPRYFGHEPITQPVFGVYRISPNGKIDLVITDVASPNGLALSPDERTLYVAENDIGTHDIGLDRPARQGGMDILAYSLDDSGMPTNRRVFMASNGARGADGLTTDAVGNVYATIQQADRQGIYVYAPGGNLLATIPTPTMPTNVALAKTGTQTFLYITGGRFLYRIEVLTHLKTIEDRP